MPAAAVLPIAKGIGAAGTGASMASGKKASNSANDLAAKQLGLQQKQFGLAQQQTGLGNQALGGASNYWNALLSGDRNAATQATGPYASMMGQNAAGARTAIQSLTPRGGEQNLALAQNYNQLNNNISRLYAGMQPLGAQNLSQIAGEYMGSGAGFNPGANTGAAAGLFGQQMQNAQSAGQGFGSLLYNSINKANQGAGGGGGKGAGSGTGAGGKG